MNKPIKNINIDVVNEVEEKFIIKVDNGKYGSVTKRVTGLFYLVNEVTKIMCDINNIEED